ncbi:hypothetical protein NHX12_010770 [Muraenolepis orangiensis]|uniref:Interleukin-12 beta central domain-containing protein n=1 Tax=Muraenolepis orangiensis TaxID=630683 RepID=A0A9Q0I9A0_9TELE|nr:hypothetical protein NHX12_010770 [Muraenolepis orangiensis]
MRGLLALMLVCVAAHRASCDENPYTLMDKGGCLSIPPSPSLSLHLPLYPYMSVQLLVLKVPVDSNSKVNITLVCGDAYKNQSVVWKKNGDTTGKVGNQVNILVKETVGGGNYSSTKHIHCSGHNYSGFHCRWSKSRSSPEATVLLVKAERNSSEIDCEVEAGGAGVWCHERTCETKEEQHLIEFHLYIYSNTWLEVYPASFYMRDIVSPAGVANLRKESANKFHWDEPASWEKPCSFYKLQYQVKVQFKANTSCDSMLDNEDTLIALIEEKKYTVALKQKKYTFCVQAKAMFTTAPWGEWAHLSSVTGTHQPL